jgi:hypothetical protein
MSILTANRRRVLGGPSVPPASTLLSAITAYWKFDETSGGTFFDSANSNDLTLNQGTYDTGGIINGCYEMVDLSGSGGLSTNSFSWDYNQPLTFNFWINFTTPGGWILSNNMATTARGHEIWIGGDDKPRFYINNNGGTTAARVIATSAVPDISTQYNMWTFTYDGGSDVSGMDILINGSSIGLTTEVNNLSTNTTISTAGLLINDKQNAGNEGSPGLYDEIGIWTRVLSGAEITELYNSGSALQYPF